jgi:hypothetical protein
VPIEVTDPAEGWGDGIIWVRVVARRGPDAEDEEDRSAAGHGGQVWAYDPRRGFRLAVRFEQSDDFEGPDTSLCHRTAGHFS